MNKNRKKHRRQEKWRTVLTIRELLQRVQETHRTIKKGYPKIAKLGRYDKAQSPRILSG